MFLTELALPVQEGTFTLAIITMSTLLLTCPFKDDRFEVHSETVKQKTLKEADVVYGLMLSIKGSSTTIPVYVQYDRM